MLPLSYMYDLLFMVKRGFFLEESETSNNERETTNNEKWNNNENETIMNQ